MSEFREFCLGRVQTEGMLQHADVDWDAVVRISISNALNALNFGLDQYIPLKKDTDENTLKIIDEVPFLPPDETPDES